MPLKLFRFAMFGALSLLLAAPALHASDDAAQPSTAAQPSLVTVVTASKTAIEARVPVNGTLVPRREVQIFANVQGHEITEILTEAGDNVARGQVLARLRDDTLSAQLAQAEAEHQRAIAGISQAESQIAATSANLTQAVASLERTRSLRQSGNAPQSLLDQAIATEAAARAEASSASDGLGVARAALSQAAAARRIAQLNLGFTTITAPVDGVIAARNAEVGDLSGGGTEPMFRLIDQGVIEFEAEIYETGLADLEPGSAALVNVAGVGQIPGKLRLMPASVDPVTRLGMARISLEGDTSLRPGLFASGWIVSDARQAVTVPVSAVLSSDQGAWVQVVKDDVIETRPVTAGLIWQDRREIISGLSEGEQVVARAGAFFRAGDQIRPVLQNGAADEQGADQAATARVTDGASDAGTAP